MLSSTWRRERPRSPDSSSSPSCSVSPPVIAFSRNAAAASSGKPSSFISCATSRTLYLFKVEQRYRVSQCRK